MTKLKTDPLSVADLELYLDGYSDFSFELRVLEALIKLEFTCQHGGTYVDPIAKKSREYDIRALVSYNGFRFHLSVECKNLRDSFPLVLHCIKPSVNERYNDLIYSLPNKDEESFLPGETGTERLVGHSIYRLTEFVAKSSDQVGIRPDGTVHATDGGVFEKISQAINSAYDLISEAFYLDVGHELRTFVCPVLVVPDSTLWQVKYLDDGSRLGPPQKASHVSYYYGKEWTVGNNSLSYSMSHLEIVEFSNLSTFVKNYLFKFGSEVQTRLGRGDTLR